MRRASAGLVLALALGLGLACGKTDQSECRYCVSAGGGAAGSGGGRADSGSGGSIAGAGAGAPPLVGLSCGQPALHAPLTRWSDLDLDRTLDQFFGDDGARLTLSDSYYDRGPTPGFVTALLDVARARAASAIDDQQSYEVCEASPDGEPTCIEKWIRDYGLELYRRPLNDAQAAGYVEQFSRESSLGGPQLAAQNVLVSMLLSPFFVFRIELAADDGPTPGSPLDPFEIAARLSYFATRQAPDDRLLASARSGALSTAAERSQQLARLQATLQGRFGREQQHVEWLAPDALSLTRPELDPALVADMQTQQRAFISDVFDRDGELLTLLTSPHQFLDARLAEHYGVGPLAGQAFQALDLEPTLFSGLLSQGAFLAARTRPTLRGKAIREALLCEQLPAPPSMPPVALNDGATPRERIENATAQSAICPACHSLMDPVGFALEAFDDQGRLTGFDTSGSIKDLRDGQSVDVAGPGELGKWLAESPLVRSCTVQRYLDYALDRPAQVFRPPDAGWVDCLSRALGSEGLNLTRLAQLLITSDAFSRKDGEALAQPAAAASSAVSPLQHAFEEASALQTAFPDATDAATLQGFMAALQQVERTEATDPGSGAAGGQAAGGAPNAGGAP
jgi:hypothetical protein